MIYSHINYCFTTWFHGNKVIANKIQKVCNKFSSTFDRDIPSKKTTKTHKALVTSNNTKFLTLDQCLIKNSALFMYNYQRWSRGHKARGQGQGHKKNPRPRPRTAFPRTDTLEAKDRNARGQGQGPRTQSASALQKEKKVFTKIFQAISTKKRFPKNFSTAPQNFNIPKNSAVLEPRTGQFSRT